MSEPPVSQHAALRARFAAAGRLLGVRLVVDDGEEWWIADDSVGVGLGTFTSRGHPDDEAEALALLELWGSVREAKLEPVRVRRRRSIAEARPELEPLLLVIDRLQAATGLLAAMPGLRGPVAAATARGVPSDLRSWPRHLQWVAMILIASLAPERRLRVGDDVRAEAERTFGTRLAGGAARLLRLALAPEPGRTSLQRFERALALTLAPYRRLLAEDAEDRGLAAPGAHADPDADPSEEGAPESGAGEDASESAGEEDQQASDDAADDDAPLGDLVASEQSAFIDRVLATPLPAQGELVGAMLDASATAEQEAGDAERRMGGTGRDAVALADYRRRSAERADAIARMREVWQRVLAERVALARAADRRASAEGEELHPDALARAVADVHAGVPRPEAFRRRQGRPQRSHEPGCTDYVLAIDRSGSMWGRPAAAAADAAIIMLEGLAGAQRDIERAEQELGAPLDLGIRTALIAFDASATLVKPLAGALSDDARRALHAEILHPAGGTNDAAALRLASEQLGVAAAPEAPARDGVERRRIVILVSDGDSNDPAASLAELRALRGAGVEVFGIGIGSDEQVRRFAPASVGIADPAELPEAVRSLVERSVASLSGA